MAKKITNANEPENIVPCVQPKGQNAAVAPKDGASDVQSAEEAVPCKEPERAHGHHKTVADAHP